MDEFCVALPSALENLQLPDPSLLNWYKLYDQRIIYIIGPIDEELYEYSKMIQLINAEDAGKPIEDRKPIKVLISSEGGEDVPTWNFVDTIAGSKTPVYTINVGMAMSNGLSILVAGHKRFSYPHAVGMYHSGSAELVGTKEQIGAAGKYVEAQDKIYEQWFLGCTNIPSNVFKKNKKTDWYLTADDMLANGMVDEIITSIEDIA